MSRNWQQLLEHWPPPFEPVAFTLVPRSSLGVLACRGQPSITHALKVLSDMLTHAEWRPTYDLIADLSEAEGPVRQVIPYLVAHREHFAGKLAIIAPSTEHTNIMLALEKVPARRLAQVCVFATPEAAGAWLGFA